MRLIYSIIFLPFIICSQNLTAASFVTVETAEQILFYPTRSSPAIVVGLNQSLIPAQTSGVVSKLLVNVGDSLYKGEIIAMLDCAANIYRQKTEISTHTQIRTQLLFNERELKRGKALLKQRNIGEAELDRIKNVLETSKAQLFGQQALLDMAALNVDRCNIKAPYNGIITKRIASLGEMVDFGKPIVEMLENTHLEVSAKIAHSDKESFEQTKLYSLDVSGKEYKVTLRTLLPLIEANTRSQEARFIFIEQQPIAGSTGRLRWKSPASYLPAHLLQKRDELSGYFIVENKIAKFIEVEGAEEGRPILFKLPMTTEIITDGRHALKNGDKVQLTHKERNSVGETQ